MESSEGSRVVARMKLCIACFQLDSEEKGKREEFEFQLRLKKLEPDADTAIKMRQLDLQGVTAPVPSINVARFGAAFVSKNFALVPGALLALLQSCLNNV